MTRRALLGVVGTCSTALGAAPPGEKGLALGCCQVEALSDAALGSWFDDIAALGVAWLRFDVMWGVVQRHGPASWDWSRYDRMVTAMLQRGTKPLLILDTTPDWARAKGTTSWHPPATPAQFGDFAGAVARRYGPLGIHHYEIWNEPNIATFWRAGPNVRQYGLLLAAAHAALKANDARAFIISGGLSPATTGAGSIAPVDFLRSLYNAGFGTYFDAVGHHPYSWPLMPSEITHWSAWSQMAEARQNLRGVMRDHGDEAKQIWLTEFGAPTQGPSSSHPVSEERHAALVAEAYAIASSRAWCGPLFLYSYRDQGTDMKNRENFFGITRADGSRKPAYTAFAQAIGARPVP